MGILQPDIPVRRMANERKTKTHCIPLTQRGFR